MESRLTAPERALLAQVFHHSAQGMVVARLPSGRIIEVNDAFLFLTGRERDEVVGLSTAEIGLFGELGQAHALRLLEERGAIDGFDANVQTPSGEARILRLSAEAITEGGDPIVVVRASDVDGRAAAGARYYELREAEVRYRALVEQIPAITYTQVEDESSATGFRDVYISPQSERILGYTAFEYQTDPGLWITTTHPEDRNRVLREDREAAEAGSSFSCEYRMIAKDGRVVWFRDEAAVFEDPASGVRFWQGVMLDLTEQKLAEATHAELEAKYRTLVEQIPAIVYLGEYGEDGDWLYISPQLEGILGYTPDEWLAHPHPMGSFVHPEDLAVVREAEERSLRNGESFRAEYRIQAKDGRWLWILDEATAVRDEQGRPFVLQGIMYDVTERKRAEQELSEALQKLRALDRLKNTLLHAVSHDLKNPLAAIRGAASTLSRLDLELSDEERRNLLRTLETRTAGVDTLVTDLLDLERLEQGIVEPRRVPVELSDLVRRLVASCDALDGRPVEVEAAPLSIAVDRPKVERIVENLLANAARHTPEGSRVWVKVLAQDGGALIVVEDDGPGVPDELKEEIFEPYSRAPQAAALPGSGIGLSLVARFAELHGGRAWVEDRPGGGASFHLFLPGVASSGSSAP